MSKRWWRLALAGALVAASGLVPAAAQEAPAVPAAPNVVDPKGDANYLNDQALTSTNAGNTTTPADVGSVSDILAVWFSHGVETISAHLQTEVPGPATTAIMYRVRVNPESGLGCLWFEARLTGAGNTATEHAARVRDVCAGGDKIVTDGVTISIDKLGDGTGVTTITAPRAVSPMFADGVTLAGPSAESRNLTPAATAPQIDNTKMGVEYVIAAPGDAPPTKPPGKDDPPGGKKGCKKGAKFKKKGCKKKGKKNEPKACAPFRAGERGAEAGAAHVLTDAHTETAPLEVNVTLDRSLADVGFGAPLPAPFQATAAPFNVQVRSKKPVAGVWALLQFPDRRDYDLDMFHTDGSYAARARGFNTLAGSQFSTAGHGGEHGTSYEKLRGIRTANCGGWTIEASNHLGEGGNFTVKLWLGEAQTDPLERGQEKP